MALKEMASIILRPRRGWLVALTAAAVVVMAGCGGRRQSLRPVFTAPRSVSAPCTNCGNGSSQVIEESDSGVPAAEPSDLGPSGTTESTVPLLEPPAGTSSGARRSPSTEPAPKASIGDEPELDTIPSQSMKPKSSKVPPAPSSKGQAPALQGPNSSSNRSTRNSPHGERAAATSTSRVRRASLQESLRPYLTSTGGNELFYPNKADRPWKYVVLHHSANPDGNYDQIDGEHRKVLGYDGCGYHFVIGNGTGSGDGEIEISQRWINQKHGVHCRNAKNSEVDEYGIGICLVGDLDKEPPTPRQLAAVKALIAYLSTRYSIPQSRVETHSHLAATPTVCPGKYFPSSSSLAKTREAAVRAPVPTSWRAVRRSGGVSY